jgi:helicase
MAFRGLFIGLDRYQSPMINWLSAAGRDGRALHALFTDTFGSGAELLIDEQATRAALESRFAALAQCNTDDIVVIAFSGHGTPSHELVVYDTDPRDLSSTGVPLETLAEWFSCIPARRLVCILDCCFSGGLGAKVLALDTVPRSYQSTESALDQLAGRAQRLP